MYSFPKGNDKESNKLKTENLKSLSTKPGMSDFGSRQTPMGSGVLYTVYRKKNSRDLDFALLLKERKLFQGNLESFSL